MLNFFVFQINFLFSQSVIGKSNFITPGDFYNGNLQEGKRHGFGIYRYSNGDVYEGDWKNDQRHGKGIYISESDKIKYDGAFIRDKYHGYGIIKLKCMISISILR